MTDEHAPLEPLQIPPGNPGTPPLSAQELNRQLSQIDGTQGAAGHRLEDPYLRELVRQQLAGDITSEEARRLGAEHLAQKHSES